MRLIALILLLFPCVGYTAGTTSIATGSPSGLYYPFGGGLASLWSKEMPGLNMKAEVTAASVVNIIQVAKHESAAGITQGDAMRDAIAGTGLFPEEMPVRALFALYPNIVHLITTKESDIHSIHDLKGKKVSIGAPGSGTAITTLNILKALGIDASDIRIQYLSYTETAESLKDGMIDAGFMVGGIGLSAMVELALTREVRLVPFSSEDMDVIHTAYPAYTAFDVPTETYKGATEPIQTVTLWNFLVVNQDMSFERAYKMTQIAFEHQKQLLGITKVARYMIPENTVSYALEQLHPGAACYLQDVIQPRGPYQECYYPQADDQRIHATLRAELLHDQ